MYKEPMETHEGASDPDAASAGLTEVLSDSQLWHLAATPAEAQLTDYEFAMMAATNGFERFVVQAARLTGEPELTFTEAVLIHVIRMHETPKDTATIARFLNRDDLPNIQYGVRKLVTSGLVQRRKVGTSTVYSVTEAGKAWTQRYAMIRKRVLLDLLADQPGFVETLRQASHSMFLMAGLMDASFRRAAAFNADALFAQESQRDK